MILSDPWLVAYEWAMLHAVSFDARLYPFLDQKPASWRDGECCLTPAQWAEIGPYAAKFSKTAAFVYMCICASPNLFLISDKKL